MNKSFYQDLGNGVFCIDAGLYRHSQVACYLVTQADQAVLIDTGTSHTLPQIEALLTTLDIPEENLKYIMPTHVHLDHAGGAGTLMERFNNARLVIHPKGARHMIDPAKLTAGAIAVYGEEEFLRHFGDLLPVPEERITLATDGLELELAGRRFTILDTPGHANHHYCVFDHGTRSFFSGDTFGLSYREFDVDGQPFLFAPTTPVAFEPEKWAKSLDRLMGYQPRGMYLTHYGRVGDPERLVSEIKGNIRDLAEAALLHEAEEPGSHREARIKADIEERLLDEIRVHGCALERERQLSLLAMDIHLNAQGLEIWLVRRSRSS